MAQEQKILGPTYEPGKPEVSHNWRRKLENREEMMRYLKAGERHWFGEEGYGSERRKTPA